MTNDMLDLLGETCSRYLADNFYNNDHNIRCLDGRCPPAKCVGMLNLKFVKLGSTKLRVECIRKVPV